MQDGCMVSVPRDARSILYSHALVAGSCRWLAEEAGGPTSGYYVAQRRHWCDTWGASGYMETTKPVRAAALLLRRHSRLWTRLGC
jgi:hypothetical protein